MIKNIEEHILQVWLTSYTGYHNPRVGLIYLEVCCSESGVVLLFYQTQGQYVKQFISDNCLVLLDLVLSSLLLSTAICFSLLLLKGTHGYLLLKRL